VDFDGQLSAGGGADLLPAGWYGFEGATNPIIADHHQAIAPDRFETQRQLWAATHLGNTVPHTENNLTIHARGTMIITIHRARRGQFKAQISFNDALGDLD